MTIASVMKPYGVVRRAGPVLAAVLALLASSTARADIVIAVVGPIDGRKSAEATTLFSAASATAHRINRDGGVNGETVSVISADDGCAMDKAKAAAESLVARKVHLVLGHPCTRSALAASEVYAASNTLFIATATRHPRLTAKRAGPTIFRLAGRDDAQGAFAGQLLARAPPDAKVAIIHDRTQYARDIAESAADAYKRERGAEPITATIIGGDKDYKLTVAKVKDAAMIFFAGFPLEGGLIYAGLRDAGSTAEFIGSDSLVTDEFASTFGERTTGARAIISSAASPSLDRDTGANDALRIHAAIDVFAAAAKRAGSNDAAKIAEALASGAFVTDLGPIGFSSDGDARIPSFQLIEWSGDAWGPPSGSQ